MPDEEKSKAQKAQDIMDNLEASIQALYDHGVPTEYALQAVLQTLGNVYGIVVAYADAPPEGEDFPTVH